MNARPSTKEKPFLHIPETGTKEILLSGFIRLYQALDTDAL